MTAAISDPLCSMDFKLSSFHDFGQFNKANIKVEAKYMVMFFDLPKYF